MELIADIFLISGAIAATVYCIVLSRRLRRFTDLEKGVGGAIALLSAQVDDMTKTLEVAQTSAAGSARSLDELTGKAEGVARRLELLVASMHDIPAAETPAPARSQTPSQVPERTSDDDAPPVSAGPTPADPPEPDKARAAESGPVFLSSRRRGVEAAE